MHFNELIQYRCSVRDYSSHEVEEEKLIQVLNAARLAPSAVNFQPYRIYVAKKGEIQDKLKSCYHREWIKNAPVLLVVVGLHDMGWKRASDRKDFTEIDVAISIDHLVLQAADLGLGTCWVCNFDTKAITEILNLKNNEDPIALIPIGYALNEPITTKKRKGLEELLVYV
jgi:nitroreductase